MNTDRKLKVYRASAGAGKTFRLAVEFIALLVKEPTAYQHILAVTFTNKATGEMKQRILSQLYGVAQGLSQSDIYLREIIKLLDSEGVRVSKEHVARQCETALKYILHDYSNFHIVTIDSFFQSIVRELANELGLAANISVELNADTVLRQAVDDIIDNLSTSSPEYDSLVRYIQSRFDDDKSWKIDDTVVEFGKNILSEHFLVHDSATRATISDKRVLDAYRDKVKAFQVERVGRLNDILRDESAAAMSALQSTGREQGFAARVVSMLGQDWTALDKWKDTYDKYLEAPQEWVNKALKDDASVLAALSGTIIPHLERIKQAMNQRARIANDAEAALQHLYNLMIVGKISEQIETINKERNHFLLAETAHFLRDVINKSNLPFIYEKTGTRIRHIMIDEFQDTSTLQWQNFKPLLTECLDAGNSCLIVGDVKQSIYRFRNSDWQVLNDIEKPHSGVGHHVQPDSLGVNRRSSPVVIDFNNNFFLNATKWAHAKYDSSLGDLCQTLTTAYADLRQEYPDDTPRNGYVRVEQLVTADRDKPQLECLARTVDELLHSGVRQSDIAILVRKSRHAADICQHFETHKSELDVNIVSTEAFRLDASVAINLIVYALRSLSAITDRLHLATLAYHYQTKVLHNESVAKDLSLPLLASDDELAMQYLPHEFVTKRDELRFKSIAEIVEDVYRIFQLSKLEGQDAYLFYFHDIIEKYASDNLADIDSFLAAWDDELHEKTIPNGQADGISLMTIHKSKGLEFHTVIVPYCNWSLDPSDSTMLWHNGQNDTSQMPVLPLMPVNYSKTKESDIFRPDHDTETLLTLVDNINVLYVAFTRAKRNLLIITDDKQAGRSKSSLGVGMLVHDTVECLTMETRADESSTISEAGQIVPSKDPDETSMQTELNPLTRKYDKLDVQFVSETSMAEFRQSNDSDIFISRQSPIESQRQHADRMRLVSLGNLYHNILQGVNTIDDLHNAVMRMDRRGCFEQAADRIDAENTLRRLIESVSGEHPQWFSHEWTPINERAILLPQPSNSTSGIGYTTLRPDRVVVKGDTAIVIDYKTARGVATTHSDGCIAVPPANRQQVEKYCELLRQLGYTHVHGYLWYILDNIVAEI